MSLKKDKAISLVGELLDSGANFTVRSESYEKRGGHGNDNILDSGFKYHVNLSKHPNIPEFIEFCNEYRIKVTWNAGTGWEFS